MRSGMYATEMTCEKVTFDLKTPKGLIDFTGDVEIIDGITYYYMRDYNKSECHELIVIEHDTEDFKILY